MLFTDLERNYESHFKSSFLEALSFSRVIRAWQSRAFECVTERGSGLCILLVSGHRRFIRKSGRLFPFLRRLAPQTESGLFNHLTFMSDQNRIPPYNIKTKPRRQVVRLEKNIN